MKFELYVVTPKGRCSKSWYFNKGSSVTKRAAFLSSNNPKGHHIVVNYRPSARHFYFEGKR